MQCYIIKSHESCKKMGLTVALMDVYGQFKDVLVHSTLVWPFSSKSSHIKVFSFTELPTGWFLFPYQTLDAVGKIHFMKYSNHPVWHQQSFVGYCCKFVIHVGQVGLAQILRLQFVL